MFDTMLKDFDTSDDMEYYLLSCKFLEAWKSTKGFEMPKVEIPPKENENELNTIMEEEKPNYEIILQ